MTTIAAVLTRIRPAAALLEGRLGPRGSHQSAAETDPLAVEQRRISRAICERVAQMDDLSASTDRLDDLTDEITALLSAAEDVRAARARAAARGAGDERRWAAHLDLS